MTEGVMTSQNKFWVNGYRTTKEIQQQLMDNRLYWISESQLQMLANGYGYGRFAGSGNLPETTVQEVLDNQRLPSERSEIHEMTDYDS